MKNIIIVGSGRSGTSLLAGLFAKSGYFMGDNLYPARDSNPKGFFEDPEINSVNEDIIARVQSAEISPGQGWLARLPLTVMFSHDETIRKRIQNLVQRQPFYFKDPRFSYTLPVWMQHLQNTSFICIFRDPSMSIGMEN